MRPHIQPVSSFLYSKACFSFTHRFSHRASQSCLCEMGVRAYKTHQAATDPSQVKTAQTAKIQDDANAEREGSCEPWTRELITHPSQLHIQFLLHPQLVQYTYIHFLSVPSSLPCLTSNTLIYTKEIADMGEFQIQDPDLCLV